MSGTSNSPGVTSLAAQVVAVHGPAVGLATDIKYDVYVNFPESAGGPGYSTTFTNVTPSHRRPSSVLEIEAAQVGDECIARLRGNEIAFLIFEGLAAGEECA